MSVLLGSSGTSVILGNSGGGVVRRDVAVGSFAATYSFDQTGWATFGIAAAQGEIPSGSGVLIDALTTQTDVKVAWPDGSLKHGVVTAKLTSSGAKSLTTQAAPSGTLTPTWPTVVVTITVGATAYLATLPAASASSNVWLSGPCCLDKRVVLTPTTAGAVAHPSLQVVFDVRSFSDGGHRLDVCVQNARNTADMDAVTYDVAINVNSSDVFTASALTQASFTRWHTVLWVSATESVPTFDFTSFYAAGLFHKFLPSISSPTYTNSAALDYLSIGPGFATLGLGAMMLPMSNGGERPDIGIQTGWTAAYLTHQTASQRDRLLKYAGYATSWSTALYDTDGASLMKITDNPSFWWDYRSGTGDKPACPVSGSAFRGELELVHSNTSYRFDVEHIPNICYPAYVVTGDRFYLDQMKLWANCAATRGGPTGSTTRDGVSFTSPNTGHNIPALYYFGSGVCRGTAWVWREIAQAGAVTPDADNDQAYFRSIVSDIQWWADYYETTADQTNALKAFCWDGDASHGTRVLAGTWHIAFMMLVVDHMDRMGYTLSTGMARLRERACLAHAILQTSAFPGGLGLTDADRFPYYPQVGVRSGSLTFLTTTNDFWTTNDATNGDFRAGGTDPPAPYYTPQGWIAAQIANRDGVTDGAAAKAFVDAYLISGTTSIVDYAKTSDAKFNFLIDVTE